MCPESSVGPVRVYALHFPSIPRFLARLHRCLQTGRRLWIRGAGIVYCQLVSLNRGAKWAGILMASANDSRSYFTNVLCVLYCPPDVL